MILKKSRVYKIGFLGSLICQIIIIGIMPYFLFTELKPDVHNFKSFYLGNNDVWTYCLFLFICYGLGMIINCISFFISNKKWDFIKLFLLILSAVPLPIIIPFFIFQFIDIDNIDSEIKIYFWSDNKVQNKNEALYRKIGLYAILCCNIIVLLQIFMMINVGLFFRKDLEVTHFGTPLLYYKIYIVIVILSLFNIIITLIFKKNCLVLLTAIISLPLIIGSAIFVPLLFLSLKSYFNNLYQNKITKIRYEVK